MTEQNYRSKLTTSFYAEEGIKESLAEEAKKQDRTKSWIINQAIKAYLKLRNKSENNK